MPAWSVAGEICTICPTNTPGATSGTTLPKAGQIDRLAVLRLDYEWLRAKLKAADAIALRDDAALFTDEPAR